jgi:hypothetical protein
MDLAVIPECFVDTNMIETLVPPVKQYNHQKGCGTVTKVMQERFSDSFAVGVIDKDKQEVKYLNSFEVICLKDNLILYKHKTRHHYIIQICPAMEQFILQNADAVGLALTDYGLPAQLDQLKKETKSTISKNDPRFKKLFKDLLKNEAQGVTTLKAWISYLKEHTYQVDIQVFKKL